MLKYLFVTCTLTVGIFATSEEGSEKRAPTGRFAHQLTPEKMEYYGRPPTPMPGARSSNEPKRKTKDLYAEYYKRLKQTPPNRAGTIQIAPADIKESRTTEHCTETSLPRLVEDDSKNTQNQQTTPNRAGTITFSKSKIS
jgi:hypothetical protein